MSDATTPAATPLAVDAPKDQDKDAIILRLLRENEAMKEKEAADAPKEVTDAELSAQMDKLNAKCDTELKSGNPSATAPIGLNKAFGFKVKLSAAQKKVYRAWCKPITKAYSEAHRGLAAPRLKVITKLIKHKPAMFSGRDKVRADGSHADVMVRVKTPAAPKPGKGLKKAKPQQVAAQVSAAPNANPPATVT